MYRIIIIEDEALIRRNIEISIDYQKLEVELVGQAKNGLEGLSLVDSVDPDIIITDIKMPVMDGIAFMNELEKRNIHKKIIVISGYDDFEYVHPSLTYGVADYIIKPIDDEELNAAIQKVINVLKREKQSIERNENIEKKLDESMPQLLEQTFINIVAKYHYTNEELEKQLEFFGILEHFQTYICLNIDYVFAQTVSAKEYDKYIIFMQRSIKTELEPYNVFLFKTDNYLCCFVSANEHIDDSIFLSELYLKCGNLLKTVSYKISLQITLGMSGVHHVLSEMKLSYEEAFYAFKEKLMGDEFSIYNYQDLVSKKSITQLSLKDIEKDILAALYTSDMQLASHKLGLFFIRLFSPSQEDKTIQYKAINDLINSFEEFVYEAQIKSTKINQLINEVKLTNNQNNNLFVLQKDIEKIISNVISETKNKKYSKHLSSLFQVKEYINKNYKKDISLDDVANKVSIAPGYFSTIFREYFGINFLQYLTNVRIAEAKKMLKYSDEKVTIIAEKCGFSDSKYFNRVFKRQVGATPIEYRNINKQ